MLNEVRAWIKSLQNKHAAFGDMPVCPFSHRARVVVISCESFDGAARLASWLTLPKYGIVMIALRDGNLSGVAALNEQLAQKDMVALVSDSRNPQIIGGYQTTQPFGTFLIIQGKAELDKARQQLLKTSYYDHWTSEALNRVGLP